jgi:hypothetical protein
MQRQPYFAHPFLERGQHFAGLLLAGAVDHRVIHVPLESDARERPGHPHVERIVQEQVRDHGRCR